MSGIIAAGSTFSKDYRTWSGDPDWHPKAIVRGKGARVLGDDDRWYIDYVSGLGSILLGHGHPDFCERVERQLWQGTNYSLPSYLEQQVAEKLVVMLGTHVPGWSADDLGVRFVLSGSDGCSAAIRLARAATGRKRIVSILYHGWNDAFVSTTPPAWGVTHPQYVRSVPYGDLNALEAAFGEGQLVEPPIYESVAAVIIEQPPQEPPAGYWEQVRVICSQHGALLILDEVVTGFRYALGGAAEVYGITPDIMVLGKALGNGIPIGAIVGRRDLFARFDLPSPVFVSGTALGHCLGLAAADAVLDLWQEADVLRLWVTGHNLIKGLAEAGYEIVGNPVRFLTQFGTDEERAYFMARMRDLGTLANRPWLMNAAHSTEDVLTTFAAAATIKAEMQIVDVKAAMVGKMPVTLFRNR